MRTRDRILDADGARTFVRVVGRIGLRGHDAAAVQIVAAPAAAPANRRRARAGRRRRVRRRSIPRTGGGAPGRDAECRAAAPDRAGPGSVGAPPAAASRPTVPLPPPTAFAAPADADHAIRGVPLRCPRAADGQKEKALVSLEYAADQGVVAAQWKLGRMYAEGDGVERSDMQARSSISAASRTITPDDNPGTPQARYVANAFVALGHYYRERHSEYAT